MNIGSNKRKIYIFHEYGAKSHYRALSWYVRAQENYEIVFREFSIMQKFIKGLITLDFGLIIKQFKNINFIIGLIFSKDRTVIVGIAPYDWRLLLYYSFLRKHKYFYHTSNTFWGYTIYPKKILAKLSLSKYIWRRFIENSKGVFCVTQKTAQGILDNYKVSRIAVVNHSFVSSYVLNENEIYFKKKSDKIKCLFVGRITESKGIGLILKLIENLPSDRFTFCFVGMGNMEEQLKEFIKYRENCSFIGYVKNPKLMEVFKSADILLVPSVKTLKWEELFGMSIVEAMACGTIPISTDHSGPREIIKDQFSGFLFSEQNYVQKSTELLEILFTDDKFVSKLKTNAFNESKKYSEAQIFQNWNKILNLANN